VPSHGELAGVLLARAYHEDRGEFRPKVLTPDTAHGTNPATVTLAGLQVVKVATDPRGGVDLDDLRAKAGPDVACLMLTNPNTLGLFDPNIVEIAAVVHDAGAVLYYDGANLNAVMGLSRPGDMGFDIVHFNLHKSFTQPHGGGGPGSGPIAVSDRIAPFLPLPVVVRDEYGRFDLDHGFHPPTVYFPLLVEEALMVEPTETETKETLDAFAEAIAAILKEAAEDPEVARTAPHTTPVRRLDEVTAAKRPVLRQALA
jgi:glycine cleavage system protein P-like pyridoxal-binding family